MSFTLYGNPGSTASDPVRLLLSEAGFTDFDSVTLNMMTADHKVRGSNPSRLFSHFNS